MSCAILGPRPGNFVGAAGLIQNASGEVWPLRREMEEEVNLKLHGAELLEMLSSAGPSRVANGDGSYRYTALFRVLE
ncbi:hypothetical protein [Deinococcus hopiensis]|uniref:hypothetical protein n=1 Tax=Deinococcus hopiensis TaxID=309885 RepID=UPI000A051806|nr:hypothetical protein [Deinococcus hopiensis]